MNAATSAGSPAGDRFGNRVANLIVDHRAQALVTVALKPFEDPLAQQHRRGHTGRGGEVLKFGDLVCRQPKSIDGASSSTLLRTAARLVAGSFRCLRFGVDEVGQLARVLSQ